MPDYELFIGTDDEARAGGDAVPLRWLPQRPGQLVPDPAPDSDRIPCCDDAALTALWELLDVAQAPRDFVTMSEPLYEASEDGPWIYRLPQDFVDRLAALTEEELGPMATSWAGTDAFDWYNPTLEPEPFLTGLKRFFRRDKEEEARRREEAKVREITEQLAQLVRLAQRARQSKQSAYLYCEL